MSKFKKIIWTSQNISKCSVESWGELSTVHGDIKLLHSQSFDILFSLGVLGPAILPSNSRLPLTMGDYINLSCIGHS